MFLKSGTRRSSRLQMLRSVLLQVRQILPVQFRHHSKRGRVTVTYLTFVETSKLMVMALLDFFSGFFDMIVAGRRDYVLMTEALFVKPV